MAAHQLQQFLASFDENGEFLGARQAKAAADEALAGIGANTQAIKDAMDGFGAVKSKAAEYVRARGPDAGGDENLRPVLEYILKTEGCFAKHHDELVAVHRSLEQVLETLKSRVQLTEQIMEEMARLPGWPADI